MEALGVAHEVEGYGHFEGCSGCGEFEGCVYVCVVGLSMLSVQEGREGKKERKMYKTTNWIYIYMQICKSNWQSTIQILQLEIYTEMTFQKRLRK